MVAYTGIKGGKVQNFSSDPSNPFVGQVWYNTTSSQVKVRSSNASGAWTTGGSLNTARNGLAGCGIQTAALAFGAPPAATESWNGTNWTSVNSLNLARDELGGAGIQTAAVAFGGSFGPPGTTGSTELWNGTSWTNNPNSMNTPRGVLEGSSGTQAAALAVGGGGGSTATEEFTGPGVAETRTVTVS